MVTGRDGSLIMNARWSDARQPRGGACGLQAHEASPGMLLCARAGEGLGGGRAGQSIGLRVVRPRRVGGGGASRRWFKGGETLLGLLWGREREGVVI